MTTLSTKIPIQANPVVASYNYTDIAEATGTSIYYGIIGPGVNTFNLVPFSDDGRIEATDYGSFANGASTVADLSAFNLAHTITGTAHITGYFKFNQASGGSVVFELFHVDGITSTETSMGTFTSLGYGDATQRQGYTSGAITETHFKRGDILRLK